MTYPDLKYLRAACLVKAADEYTSIHNLKKARQYYAEVLASKDPELADYRRMAKIQLDVLADASN